MSERSAARVGVTVGLASIAFAVAGLVLVHPYWRVPHVGLSATVSLSLSVAFLETAVLWWLYFGTATERTRDAMRTCADPGRLARDAYTYLHVPIVASVIAVAVRST